MADIFFIERGDDQKYRATQKGANRASVVGDTQKEVGEAAKKMHPDATFLAERQRETDKGGRDKWRKF